MSKPMKWTVISLIVVIGGLIVFNMARSMMIKHFLSNMPPPTATISTAIAESQVWYPYIPAIGSLSAVQGVDVSAELPGQVIAINFESGQHVEQGQSLVQLDDSLEQEELNSALAALELAQLQFDRFTTLTERQASSTLDLDTARAELENAKATAAKIQTQVDKKNIKAPFAGRIGIRKVNLGQYVQPGEDLVTLQSLNPLYVDFWLPATELNRLAIGQAVRLTVGAYSDNIFEGEIHAINSKVDAATRNISIQATIPNENETLYPGMYANINVVLPEQYDVITLPQTALAYSLYGDSVFIVEQDSQDDDEEPVYKARRVYVTAGEERDNLVVITEGIEAGQEVVASGQLKVNDGTILTINNEIELKRGAENATLY